ncbi:MAG: hypothetical protein KatS3mg057_0506 [Herpetosiphonaceae bacterium]|nr:MAG: hypothetical protein KatS3mg057_0506 [Herpetosiphonaceae bacterium]
MSAQFLLQVLATTILIISYSRSSVTLIQLNLSGSQAVEAQSPSAASHRLSELEQFRQTVTIGQPGLVTGVFVPDTLALRVVQQPADDPTYVSEMPGYATQFMLAEQVGSIGLLAHNYLSGALFFDLQPGQVVSMFYGDGSERRYRVVEIRRFRAMIPNDPYSNFEDLESGAQLSSTELFYEIYTGVDRVVFQTCISVEHEPSWGRLFVIADPLE